MSKKFRLLMALVLITGLFGGLLTGSTVSADPVVGDIIEIPRIDVDDVFGTGDWDTKIQIQNVGPNATTVTVEFFKAYSEKCPPNAPARNWYLVQQWVPAGGVWTLHSAIPALAESAFITHVPDAGDTELAVTVDRWGPDPLDDVEISSSYTGIVDDAMVGPGPPYEYYAPYVMHSYNNLDTTITIQNSGDICASIWIYYKEEGNCEMQKAQHIELLTPGESIRIGPGADADMAFPSPEIGSDWLGSAYVTSNVPLAIIVDQLSITGDNAGTLLTMRGMPFDQGDGERKWYADLLYREISGWTSSIQVQNLTQGSMPTFVTVDFFDQSGDEILFVGDWICRNAATTFYLPAIVDLGINFPFGYVGAAEIESHGQVDYPGDAHDDGEPIFAVVDIKKTKMWDGEIWRHTGAGETQGGAYNAHPEHQKVDAWGWAMPFIAKEQEGVTSRIAIRNNSNCNKINGAISINDETGRTVATIPVPYLHPKHMKVVDLNYFGHVWPGFLGAATFDVGSVEQLCDIDGDGETDITPVMPSVVVLNYGYDKELPHDPYDPGPDPVTEGDLTRVYEAIPFGYMYSPCIVTFSGNVIDKETTDPVGGVDIKIDDKVKYTTDSTGWYSFPYSKSQLKASETFDLVAYKEGYLGDLANSGTESVTVVCDDITQNFELVADCNEVSLDIFVEDKETGLPITGLDATNIKVSNAEMGATVGAVAPGTVAGEYYVTGIAFDADGITQVIVTLDGYNPVYDTVFWPACGENADLTIQMHQTPKSKILLYWGNGAEDVAGTDYDAAEAMFKYMGYLVDYTKDWPTDPDLEEYKVIFLLGPGNKNDDPASDEFTPGQIAQLDLFLRNGGRLVVMTDADEVVSVENLLLDALNDLDLAFNAGNIAGTLADDLTANPNDQLLGGATPDVDTLDFNTAISITVGANAAPGSIAALSAPHPDAGDDICAADTMPGVTRLSGPAFAGDVVAIGDLDWMDDASFMGDVTYNPVDPAKVDYFWPDWPADNENLLLNLIDF